MDTYEYKQVQFDDGPSTDGSVQGIDMELGKDTQQRRYNTPRCVFRYMICSLVSFAAGLSISQWTPSNDLNCWRTDSNWSPALGQIDLSYHEVRFHGTLDAPSEYRGPPSQSVDEAWDTLENVQSMWISPEDFKAFGGNPETSAKLSEEHGGLYVGELEVFHQLHCVNYLRKASHWNWEHYVDKSLEFKDSEATQKVHFDHCVEMLRKQLTCKADVGFINLEWVNRTSLGVYPNFNTMHKCRNYDSIRKFVTDRAVDGSILKDLAMQPGQRALTQLP